MRGGLALCGGLFHDVIRRFDCWAEEGKAKYYEQLELMHQVTVAAMKCKQTTEAGNVARLKRAILGFSNTYFSGKDLEHIREHHAGGHEHADGHR